MNLTLLPLQLSFLVEPNPKQIREIFALYRDAQWWPSDKDMDSNLIQAIIRGSHCFAIATAGEEVMAMGRAISDRASDAYIQDLTVKREYRGHGIGSQILTMIIDRLQQDRIAWIALIAEKNSSPFYEKKGFLGMKNSLPMLLTGSL